MKKEEAAGSSQGGCFLFFFYSSPPPNETRFAKGPRVARAPLIAAISKGYRKVLSIGQQAEAKKRVPGKARGGQNKSMTKNSNKRKIHKVKER